MEYNNPSQLVKHLNFGDDAKDKVMSGVDKLAKAVKKDGVTVAESVVLLDPVENIGATLIKEAAKNTVKEAGDGTTTAIVLAESLLKIVRKEDNGEETIREIKDGIV